MGSVCKSIQLRSSDMLGERSRQPFHEALPFCSSQGLTHGRDAHFRPGRQFLAVNDCKMPWQLRLEYQERSTILLRAWLRQDTCVGPRDRRGTDLPS